MTTLALPTLPQSPADEARAMIREAEREALQVFVDRYGFWHRGEQYVGTPEHRVPAGMAIENTLNALWK